MKKKAPIVFIIVSVFAVAAIIIISAYRSSESYRKAKAAIQWDCSVSCTEKSTSAQYVITYSNVKVSSKTGTLTIQNRNDFEIVVHLLCEGEQEIVSGNISAGGCYSFANVTDKEYTVGIHADVDAATNIKVIVYDGKDTEPFTLSWTQIEKYIDLMIQSDRYLTDKEKEHRAAVQEAERQLPMLDGDAAAEYNALKEQYSNTLIGFELGGYFLFYDKDAITVKEVLRSNLLSQENALGRVKVTGFPTGQWAADAKKLWAEGNSIYLAGQSENGTHHRTKYLREEDYLPIGSIIKLDGRDFRVDHVNFMFKSVSLQDMDLTNSGQPIFRSESLPHIRELYEQQQDEIVDVSPEKTVDYKVGDEVVVDATRPKKTCSP